MKATLVTITNHGYGVGDIIKLTNCRYVSDGLYRVVEIGDSHNFYVEKVFNKRILLFTIRLISMVVLAFIIIEGRSFITIMDNALWAYMLVFFCFGMSLQTFVYAWHWWSHNAEK